MSGFSSFHSLCRSLFAAHQVVRSPSEECRQCGITWIMVKQIIMKATTAMCREGIATVWTYLQCTLPSWNSVLACRSTTRGYYWNLDTCLAQSRLHCRYVAPSTTQYLPAISQNATTFQAIVTASASRTQVVPRGQGELTRLRPTGI